MASQLYWRAGSILGASGIALGAYGAHGLSKVVGDNPTKIKNWATAAQFQIIHGVALLALASIPPSVRRIHPVAKPLILGGTLMFSGSMYLLTLDREKFRFLGPTTPFGGILLIAGWAALMI